MLVGRMEHMARPRMYPDEFRERAAGLVREWRDARGRLMRQMGLAGRVRGRHQRTTVPARPPPVLRTWSAGASRPVVPTPCGWPTSPIRRPSPPALGRRPGSLNDQPHDHDVANRPDTEALAQGNPGQQDQEPDQDADRCDGHPGALGDALVQDLPGPEAEPGEDHEGQPRGQRGQPAGNRRGSRRRSSWRARTASPDNASHTRKQRLRLESRSAGTGSRPAGLSTGRHGLGSP